MIVGHRLAKKSIPRAYTVQYIYTGTYDEYNACRVYCIVQNVRR